MKANALIARCRKLYAEGGWDEVSAWKRLNPGRPAVGTLPMHLPREVIHACGALPVGLAGSHFAPRSRGGEDACLDVCHHPLGAIEQGLTGEQSALDAMLFPNGCHLLGRLFGVWKMLFPERLVRTLESFSRPALEHLIHELRAVGGRTPTAAGLTTSIAAYNANRLALDVLYQLRADAPWTVSAEECFLVARAGYFLEVSEHTRLLNDFVAAAAQRPAGREPRIRVLLAGEFCEESPLTVLAKVQTNGCCVVDDDLNLGLRSLKGLLGAGPDPLTTLALAYDRPVESEEARAASLVARLRRCKAEAVIFAPSAGCNPGVADLPSIRSALRQERVAFLSFAA